MPGLKITMKYTQPHVIKQIMRERKKNSFILLIFWHSNKTKSFNGKYDKNEIYSKKTDENACFIDFMTDTFS